jgi:hypothetical protein
MKFVKQLSEDEFLVKMEPGDADPTKTIVLAHDYLQFNGRDWTCTDLQIEGPYGFANVVYHKVHVQIPIRMAQDILKNVLTPDRKFLKEEHLQRDGGPVYCDQEGDKYFYYKDDGSMMVAIYDPTECKYIHLPGNIVTLVKSTFK